MKVFWVRFYSFNLVKDRYSFIAPVYSLLAKLVFGSDLKKSKLAFISKLRTKKLLIVGGGDGLDYRDFDSDLNGEYWELSPAMLLKAKDCLKGSQLTFHLGQFNPDPQRKFDEVWLHFVLDTMPDAELEAFLLKVKNVLKVNGLINLCDFFPPQTYKQQILHGLMITFFRITTGHPRKDVPDYPKVLKKLGFQQEKKLSWRRGWIRAQLWKGKT